ncbi:hypothetical protein [Sinanaerobacter sp. ZZT-01]|uniref:hypothetical protein n=1 Tax=Sinanaerobacter sp. ZZT-01 TaxID=3111540 RepID=UPI002D79221A|nr:hypothetical protein [Sinanaerobacter sp. ZZT-01]WRR92306.1 hypothetical protein U5921_09535 [Sinanaerobacter sp. ZZT-01]
MKKSLNDPLAQLAKDYSNNAIKISGIAKFIRKPDDKSDCYLSSKNAFSNNI